MDSFRPRADSLADYTSGLNVPRVTRISMPLSRSGRSSNGGRIRERVDRVARRRWSVVCGTAGRKVKRLSADDKTDWKAAHRELIYDATTLLYLGARFGVSTSR